LVVQLLLGAALLLSAAAIGVSAILHEQKERRRFRERLAQVSHSHARVNPMEAMGRGVTARSGPEARLIAAAARLFGYDPNHAEHYPIKWWIVLIITLVLARLVALLLDLLVDNWRFPCSGWHSAGRLSSGANSAG
jgi:hypothetical protein